MSNTRKILDKITSKTKIYLVIILVLLIVLCIYEHNFIIPSVSSMISGNGEFINVLLAAESTSKVNS